MLAGEPHSTQTFQIMFTMLMLLFPPFPLPPASRTPLPPNHHPHHQKHHESHQHHWDWKWRASDVILHAATGTPLAPAGSSTLSVPALHMCSLPYPLCCHSLGHLSQGVQPLQAMLCSCSRGQATTFMPPWTRTSMPRPCHINSARQHPAGRIPQAACLLRCAQLRNLSAGLAPNHC